MRAGARYVSNITSVQPVALSIPKLFCVQIEVSMLSLLLHSPGLAGGAITRPLNGDADRVVWIESNAFDGAGWLKRLAEFMEV